MADIAAGDGSVIICRRCGSGRVDHLSRGELYCAYCGHGGAIASAFAVVRARWLPGDLARVFQGRELE